MKHPWLERGGLLGAAILGAALVASMSFGVSEEMQFGGVTGQVTIKGTVKPLPNAEVILQPQFELPESVRWSPSVRTDSEGRFAFSKLPAGIYEAQVYGRAHALTGIQVRVAANKTDACSVAAERTMADLEVRISQRVMARGESPAFEMSGVTQDREVKVSVFQVGLEAASRRGSLYEIASSLATGRNRTNPALTPGLKEVRRLAKKITSSDLEGAFAERASLDPLPEGVYLLRVTHSTGERMAWFTVTDLALVIKSVDRSILAYAVDIKTGQPVAGAPVTLSSSGRTINEGKTGQDGILRFQRPPLAPDARAFIVSASRGASRAFAWQSAWDSPSESSEAPARLWVKTDRPIYRPGDLIQAKGVARLAKGGQFETPTAGRVKIKVLDPSEEEVFNHEAPVNSFGCFDFKFPTSAEVSGTYRMEMSMNDRTDSSYIEVVPFRKPEYTINVTPERKAYRRGESIKVKVKAEYYTGEPVTGAKVFLEVSSSDMEPGSPLDEGFSPWGDSSGSYVDGLKGVTDSSGEAVLTYRPKPEDQEDRPYDSRLDFDARVSDASERSFEGSGSALVTRGTLDVRAEMDSWVVQRGSLAKARITVADVESRKPVPGQHLKLTFKRIRWVNRANEAKEVETILGTSEKTAGPGGSVEAFFTPSQEGSYSITAEAVDPQGRKIEAKSEFWCASESWNGDGMASGVRVVVDRTSFGPKDDVEGIVQLPSPGGTALLTVEGDTLVKAQLLPIKGVMTRFNVGPLGTLAPGAEIKVVYIKDKKYYESSSPFEVRLDDKSLRIDVIPSRKEARPGDEVTYTLKASTPEGAPARAELSLGVVDEGIYQMASDDSGPLKGFYQPHMSAVQTEFSFPDLYLDGEDKGKKNIQIRKTFVDTAYWAPHVATDENGLATVKVRMPDNLTSWRATVTGVTADSRMGQSTANVIVRKDLMIRLNAPSYMVEDDVHSLGAVVTNGTDQEQKVEVDLAGTGISINEDHSRFITVPARSTKRLDWRTTAEKFGTASLKATAIAGPGLSDGLEVPVDVYPKAQEVVSGESGSFEGSPGRTISFSREAAAVDGELAVRIDPSPLAALFELVPSLVDDPYGCVEQTLSRFQPTVSAMKVLARSQMGSPVPEEKISRVVRESLVRLRTMQHSDGGWGWWEYDKSSTLMTAAVLEGLHEAKEAGVKVNEAAVKRALDWTDETLKGPRVVSWDQNTFYLAYARLLWGPSSRAVTVLKEEEEKARKAAPAKRPMGEDALLAIGLKQAGLADEAQSAYRRFKAGLEGNPDAILREEYFWGETRGRALEALALFEPFSPLTDRVIQVILRDRKGLMETGTRCIAMTVNGILRAEESRSALSGEVSASAMNHEASIEAAGRRTSAKVWPAGKPMVLAIPLKDLPQGKFEVKVACGAPRATYSASFRRRVKTQTFAASMGEGFTLTRSFHRVAVRTLANGDKERSAEDAPRTAFQSGEIYKVKMVVQADRDLNYLLIEDPIPSGASLVEASDPYGENEALWWDRVTALKDKAVFFKRNLPKGRHVFFYTARAETPGKSLALPARLSLFYEPNTPSMTGASELEIQ